ncbi:hypothetical protein DL93DRAFT_2090221 [Clavulina sp. PMI_390]|nr:hypothetical protein DL93DRAFT_2090221 [Clavulina sp. PMI_390]
MKWGAFSALSSILAFGSGPGRSHRYTQPWTSERRIAARDATKALWQHGFDSYMDHAYPFDELSPISCTGQGPDWKNPAAIHLNDVNANVSIALLDNLDSFVVLRNQSGFAWAVNTVLQTLSFDVDTKPQVFEITIRGVGSLLSAHMFANDKEGRWGFGIEGYDGGLLRLAKDLGERLLPAFNTPTGMPYARVNLRRGVTTQETTESCTAGAGSLLLEFTTLSRLTGDPRFEAAARRAFFAVWNRRSKLGLVGNAINVRTGDWIEPLASGIGAGIDSFFEYALKMYIMSGEEAYLDVWNDSYGPLLSHSRSADGFWFRSIAMRSGELAAQHIDSLGAFWPGLQVLAGDLENAIKSHLAYWGLWKRFSGIPETFNIYTRQAISLGYPLRPEFIESTYFLYQATHDSFYLDVGARILEDLNRRAKVQCGLATISNLLLDQKENRMESFALSETLKYLYLLFDEENPLNKDAVNLVFTTEGHPLPVMNPYRTPSSLKPPTYRTHENHTTPILDPPSDALLPPQFPVRQGAYSRRSKTCPRYRHPHIPSLKPKRADQPSSAPALLGTIRDRGDFEYARLLSGISVTKDASQGMGFPAAKFASTSNAKVNQRYDPESWKYEFGGDKPLLPGVSASEGTTKQLAVVTEEDKEWWDAHGSCEVPKVEEYVSSSLLNLISSLAAALAPGTTIHVDGEDIQPSRTLPSLHITPNSPTRPLETVFLSLPLASFTTMWQSLLTIAYFLSILRVTWAFLQCCAWGRRQ